MKTPARLKGKTQKIISILIVFVFMLAFVNLISCNDVGKEEAIKIEKTDSKKIETLYVGVEYDASNLFVREEGVNYEIEKLFCFNKEFEKIDIPFDGFKFTQTEKRDVSVVIKASKNGLESRRLFELKANRVKETESLDLDSPNRTAADRFEYEFVDNTGCSVFSQTITQKKENVKDGIHAIKCVYGETKNMNNAVYVESGGSALLMTTASGEAIYKKFSAYNKETASYYKAGEKTYVGFWVKNATGKQLSVKFNLILWGETTGRTIVTHSAAINTMEEALVIDGNDYEWHYYEAELSNLPYPMAEYSPIIRTALAAVIKNPEEGDTFYVDAIDIYHGSRK